MRRTEAGIFLSPSDLSNHLACAHLTMLDLAVAQGHLARPGVNSLHLDVLRARGLEHERNYVDSLRQSGLTVVDLTGSSLQDDDFDRTREAMASGAGVVVQAPLGHGQWAGYADILLRVDHPSDLGDWSYEVADTKLARETRSGTILQLCAYSEMVCHIQGRPPHLFHVVSPGNPFVHLQYRLFDFGAYYRFVLARLERVVASCDDVIHTYPEPTPHCDICRWWSACDTRRHQDDHLSLVAGIRRTQRTQLERQGITTLSALAKVPVPLPFKPKTGSRDALVRVREQARVQHQGQSSNAPYYELLQPSPERGLMRLPAPSTGDIFLDFEGDPFVATSGREYLFGWVARADDGAWQYHSRWALTPEAEKAAFEEFMGTVMSRLQRHTDLHIYHYAPYEPAALKRMMSRYVVCEEMLDHLLRASVLVDLYTIARQTLVASVEHYSIKALEPFYEFARETPLRDASHALRQVEYLLETGHFVLDNDDLQQKVTSYNRDDCLSAVALREWLEELRQEHLAQGVEVPRPVLHDSEPDEQLKVRDAKAYALMGRLLADVPSDLAQRTKSQQAVWLLGQLLHFHRREDKAVWWEFYRLADLEDESLNEEKEALVGLEFLNQVASTKKTATHRYRFPPQEVDIPIDADLLSSASHKVGTLVALDRESRTIDIKHLAATVDERPTKVISRKIFYTDVIADSLMRLGEWVASHNIEGVGVHLAARRLLLGSVPVLSSGVLRCAWRNPKVVSILLRGSRSC